MDYAEQRNSTSGVIDKNGAASVDLPVNADFASGYGIDPQGVEESVTRCVATGVAGLSVEDATGDPSAPRWPLRHGPASCARRKP